MHTRIGETAGSVFRVLKDNQEVAISQLPKMMNEKDTLVYQALGWLAREGKVQYRTAGNKTMVSLRE